MEDEHNNFYCIDLMMPISVHWQVSSLLHEAEYLLASQEHMADVQEVYRQVFRTASPYAVYEADRLWLSRRSQASGPI